MAAFGQCGRRARRARSSPRSIALSMTRQRVTVCGDELATAPSQNLSRSLRRVLAAARSPLSTRALASATAALTLERSQIVGGRAAHPVSRHAATTIHRARQRPRRRQRRDDFAGARPWGWDRGDHAIAAARRLQRRSPHVRTGRDAGVAEGSDRATVLSDKKPAASRRGSFSP